MTTVAPLPSGAAGTGRSSWCRPGSDSLYTNFFFLKWHTWQTIVFLAYLQAPLETSLYNMKIRVKSRPTTTSKGFTIRVVVQVHSYHMRQSQRRKKRRKCMRRIRSARSIKPLAPKKTARLSALNCFPFLATLHHGCRQTCCAKC